ncbi:ECF transporter S component [Companilactobacillus halodurans]|uniref:ECF transporter S component n=1 Tax=Companilactobacillus halodurans TaxID=2584183 RepID=A0A5P0ZMT2_9LACO|nr:ECF transporter S component [Companilactobacillus halodurans]MQS75533.1 ECF transporter S component [Companilactobacillus halodurans]MQS97777.1 ECF transporter S component [Companilactobacillus halodurans]
MGHSSVKTISLIAILTALTVGMSLLVVIPIPNTKGMVTLCEVGIFTSAILFKNPVGFSVGAISGFLIDIISGFPVWCLFSLVIHGLEGFVVAYLVPKEDKSIKKIILPLLLGSIIMVVGYCLATILLFGIAAGLASIIGNIFQVVFGLVVTLLIVKSLARFSRVIN